MIDLLSINHFSVVQSDHSNPQQLTLSSSSLTPQGTANGTLQNPEGSRRISNPDSVSRVAQSASGTSLVTPPPNASRTTSPHEHKVSNASSASSGGTRRVGSTEPLNNHYEKRIIKVSFSFF